MADLAALALVVLLGLGTWQLERLEWKQRLIAARDVALAAPAEALPATSETWSAFDFRPVVVEGTFRHDLEQLFGVAAMPDGSATTS